MCKVIQYYYDRKKTGRVIKLDDILQLLSINSKQLRFQCKVPFKVVRNPNRLNKMVEVNGTLTSYLRKVCM